MILHSSVIFNVFVGRSWSSSRRLVYFMMLLPVWCAMTSLYANSKMASIFTVGIPLLNALHNLLFLIAEVKKLDVANNHWLMSSWIFHFITAPGICYLTFLKPVFSPPNIIFWTIAHSSDGAAIHGGFPLGASLMGSTILAPFYASIDFRMESERNPDLTLWQWLPRGILVFGVSPAAVIIAALCQPADESGDRPRLKVWLCLSPYSKWSKSHPRLQVPAILILKVLSFYTYLEEWILLQSAKIDSSWLIALVCIPIVAFQMGRAILFAILFGDGSCDAKLPPTTTILTIAAALCIGKVEFGTLMKRIGSAEALLKDLLPPRVVEALLNNSENSPGKSTMLPGENRALNMSTIPFPSEDILMNNDVTDQEVLGPNRTSITRTVSCGRHGGRGFSESGAQPGERSPHARQEVPHDFSTVHRGPYELNSNSLQVCSIPRVAAGGFHLFGNALMGGIRNTMNHSLSGAPQQQRQQPLDLSRTPDLARSLPDFAEWHSDVTLLFADIKGFTNMCQQVEPQAVMKMLNELYHRFDALTAIHPVYKVETIGDCYFAASGLLHDDPNHSDTMIRFAMDMMEQARQVDMPTGEGKVTVRIGIHSGRVMSGIVGQLRRRYCLFGDTVNTASRMESTGLPGFIQMSEATHSRLKLHVNLPFVSRGPVECKGKGEMMTYLLEPC